MKPIEYVNEDDITRHHCMWCKKGKGSKAQYKCTVKSRSQGDEPCTKNDQKDCEHHHRQIFNDRNDESGMSISWLLSGLVREVREQIKRQDKTDEYLRRFK